MLVRAARSAVAALCVILVACADGISPAPRPSQLAYTRWITNENGSLLTSQLYLIDADGGEPLPLDGEHRYALSPSWSPDGDRLAFMRLTSGYYEIMIADVDDGSATPLPGGFNAQWPAWSPDGGRIAFSRNTGTPNQPVWDIFVIPSGGGTAVRLTNSSLDDGVFRVSYDAHPAWSPDGRRIAFVNARSGNAKLFVMNADGTSPVQLTTGPGSDRDPTWSPDGQRIAFTGYRDNDVDIYSVKVDGSELRRLTNDPGAEYLPAWSPDGEFIAYTKVAELEQVYVMRADGSESRRVTPAHDVQSRVMDLNPAWRPRR
jgi:Tol biopolymer transport system component